MYGLNSHPLVPLTGFGMAGTSMLAGYPILAIGLSCITASIVGIMLVRGKSHQKGNT